jgi:hypothetical protein
MRMPSLPRLRERRSFVAFVVLLLPASVGAAVASCTSTDAGAPTCTIGGALCIDASFDFEAATFDAPTDSTPPQADATEPPSGDDAETATGTDAGSSHDAADGATRADASDANAIDASSANDASDAADASDAGFDANGPFVVASGTTNPHELALAGGYLYWIDGNDDIGRVSVNGGAVTTIAAGSAQKLAADVNGVYWTAGAANVYGQATTATTPTEIGHFVAFNPYMLVSNGGFLYWPEYSSSGSIQRIPIAGDVDASVSLAGSSLTNPDGITFVGSQMYIAVSDGTQGNGTISAVLPDAGLQNLVSGRFGPAGVITDGTRLYWVDNASSPNTVASVAVTGGAVLQYSTNSLHPSIATDGVNLYWAESSGGIEKTPVASVQLSTLYNFSYSTSGIAVDAAWVYWADAADGIIYKIAK